MEISKERFWIHRLPWRRKDKDETKAAQIKFRPQIQIIRQDEWPSLVLSLVNQSSFTVWVEQVSISLADLRAESQTAQPFECITQQILQYVQPRESVTVSLANAVYDAAGRPQGPYTCLLLATVQYSVFDEWCDVRVDACRVGMATINVINLHAARWYDKKMKI